MAMNKKPKPLRPNPLKATLRGESASAKPVVKVKPKGVLRKSTVKNPNARTGSGAASGSVRVLTKSESALKKGNPQSNKSDGKRTPPSGRNRNMTEAEKYKKSTGNQRLIENTQQIAKKGYVGLTAAEKREINPKGKKTSGVTPPKKKTPPAPKPKGRGGRGFGGMGGGGGLFGGRGLSGTR